MFLELYAHAPLLSCVQLFETPWTVAHQGLLFMGLSEQEYWKGLLLSPSGFLLDSGKEPVQLMAPALLADSLPLSHQEGPPELHSRFSLFIYFIHSTVCICQPQAPSSWWEELGDA